MSGAPGRLNFMRLGGWAARRVFATAAFLGGGGSMHERLLQRFAVLRQIEALDLVLLVHPQR